MFKIYTTILSCVLTVLILSGCESRESKRIKVCTELQERVDRLNMEYGGTLRGNWGKVPEEIDKEIHSLEVKGGCRIAGDTLTLREMSLRFRIPNTSENNNTK